MTPPPLRTRLILGAVVIIVMAGFADWAFLLPDDPFEAFFDAGVAGGSATVALLPFMFS